MCVLDNPLCIWRNSLLVSAVILWGVFWIRPDAIARFSSYPLRCVLDTSWGNWRDSLLVSVVTLWCVFWIRPDAIARFSSYPLMYVLDTSWCNCSFQQLSFDICSGFVLMHLLVSVVTLWCMFWIHPDAIARFSSYPLMYVLDTSWCNCSFQQLSFDICSGFVLMHLLVWVVTLWCMFLIRPDTIARFSSYPLMYVLDTSWCNCSFQQLSFDICSGFVLMHLLVSVVTLWCMFWIRPDAIARFSRYPLMCVLDTS